MEQTGAVTTGLMALSAIALLGVACGSSDGSGPPGGTANPDGGDPSVDGAAGPVDSGPPPSRDGMYALAGLDPALPRTDLAPIGRIAAEASVVGLGESIHTSGGFYRAKVRVLEYLVQDLGFRVIAFETPWGFAEKADAYVQTCGGTSDDATKNLHTIWWDTSVSGLLAFLCTWNQAHPTDRVRFAGFDIREPWLDAPALRLFLAKGAPTEEARLMDGLAKCLGVGYADERAFFSDPKIQALYAGTTPLSDDARNSCAAGVSAVKSYLETNADKLVSSTSQDEHARARLRNVGMGAFTESIYQFIGRDSAKGQEARDVAMFDVFRTLRAQQFPRAKVGIWAHNLHLTRKNPEIEFPAYRGATTLGTLLDRDLGPRYVPIGVVGYKIGIDWTNGLAASVFDSPKALERKLHDSGATLSFLDLVTKVEAPFAGEGSFEVSTEKMRPSTHYAGLLFMDDPEFPTWVGGVSPFKK